MTYAYACENQTLSPLRTIVDLAICIFVAGSLIPQIVRFAIIDRSSGAGVSGWYIILLTVTATAHLAARTGGTSTKATSDYIRNGNLSGWRAFSALVMCIQILVHWMVAVALLAVYVYFRHGLSRDNEYYFVPAQDGDATLSTRIQDQMTVELISASEQPSTPLIHSTTTGPSNTAIVAIVATHAFIVMPPALYILLSRHALQETLGFGLFQQGFYLVLAIMGLATSVAALIPQIYLMVSRSSEGLGLGNLSILSTGLQILAYAALCVSQSARLWVWRTEEDMSVSWMFWAWFLTISGPAVTYGVLALGQLVVLCVALGLGREHGSLHL